MRLNHDARVIVNANPPENFQKSDDHFRRLFLFIEMKAKLRNRNQKERDGTYEHKTNEDDC
jgi:hypothetical protein